MRVRPDEQHGNHELVSFNPRTREGATHQLIWHVPQRNSFNPRTREGATSGAGWIGPPAAVSIHAPVRVRRPEGYGLSIKGAARGLRQPDAEAGYGQVR